MHRHACMHACRTPLTHTQHTHTSKSAERKYLTYIKSSKFPINQKAKETTIIYIVYIFNGRLIVLWIFH